MSRSTHYAIAPYASVSLAPRRHPDKEKRPERVACGSVQPPVGETIAAHANVARRAFARFIQPSSSGSLSVSVTLDRVQVLGNANFGVYIDGANARIVGGDVLMATIEDTLASDSGNEGFRIESPSGTMLSNVTIRNSRSLHNGIGVGAIGSYSNVFVIRSLFVGDTALSALSDNGLITGQGDNSVIETSGPLFSHVVTTTY